MLVLYVIPLDADAHIQRPSAEYASGIFGLDGTRNTGRKQVRDCSRGELDIVPACATDEQACFGQSQFIVNGVIEVPIEHNITGIHNDQVANWAVSSFGALIVRMTYLSISSYLLLADCQS